jgi:hypothetical protein
MMRIIETTDGKHRGTIIDESQSVIVFDDGYSMGVVSRRTFGKEITLSNPNYIIRGITV